MQSQYFDVTMPRMLSPKANSVVLQAAFQELKKFMERQINAILDAVLRFNEN